MSRELIIGVDAGTSVIKAVAFDLEGRQLDLAALPNRYEEPGGGAVVPAGTEIASPRTAGSESVVFQTAEELVVPHECKLASHGGNLSSPGDALLLGFDSPIAEAGVICTACE